MLTVSYFDISVYALSLSLFNIVDLAFIHSGDGPKDYTLRFFQYGKQTDALPGLFSHNTSFSFTAMEKSQDWSSASEATL